jgi:hypothetical protein
MHDIDSTRLESSPDQNEYLEHQEFETDMGEAGDNFEMPMSEEEEEALAAELLSVSSEEEMDQFFGKLFRKLRPAIGGAARFLAQNAGPLRSALKGIAKKALPFVGGALGTAIPIPGVGTALGSALGKAAGNLLEMETDELEVEEREFEMARRFVRFASHAVRQGSRLRNARFNPTTRTHLALRRSIQRLRRSSGFRSRPYYRPCPPCPPCPEPPSAGDFSADDGAAHHANGAPNPGTPASSSAPSGEFEFETGDEFETDQEFETEREFEHADEFETHDEFEGANQGEEENYEYDHEAASTSPTGGSRSGRWVRRGRKIVLYGL